MLKAGRVGSPQACAAVNIHTPSVPVVAKATCEAVASCVYTHGTNTPLGCIAHIDSFSASELAVCPCSVVPLCRRHVFPLCQPPLQADYF